MIKTPDGIVSPPATSFKLLQAADSSVIFDGLSGVMYTLDFAIKCAGPGDVSLLFNGDADGTNYKFTNLVGAQTNQSAYLAYSTAVNDFISGTSTIISAHNRVSAYHHMTRVSGSAISNIGVALARTSDLAGLTQFEIKSPVTGMFLEGSMFRLTELR